MADDRESYTVVPAAPGEIAALLDIEDGRVVSQVTVPIVAWRIPKRRDLAPVPVPVVAAHGKTAVFVYLPDSADYDEGAVGEFGFCGRRRRQDLL
jgi:hypothetical protein